MNIKIKLINTTILKLRIRMLFVFCFIVANLQAQDIVSDTTKIETQADLDWKALLSASTNLGVGLEEAEDNGVLEVWKYLDKIFKKKSRMAKAFFDTYPQDPRRQEALSWFFNYWFKPHFLTENISDSLTEVFAGMPPRSYKQKMRLKPIDLDAKKQWLQIGDDMVKCVVNSNVSIELKEDAEFKWLTREFWLAYDLDSPLSKDPSERAYWNRFEIQYWQHSKLLLEKHINKYASLDIVAQRVKNILDVLNYYSVAAAEAYWQYFYETTGSNNPQADQLGIKAIHKLAKEHVVAIEVSKKVDFSKPLDMAFTAMDGTKVNLSKMRGKVVLIDFWATYCGPCIKEIPHVRAMYDKYRDQGFEVIGLAADQDKNKERIEAILKKTKANWPQRLDLGSDAPISFHALYNIKALPTVWLLNKEGVIVDRDARGTRLEPLIRKYLDL